MTFVKNGHCSYCGSPFADHEPWPRRCEACGNVSYRNPIPVAVVLLPVGGGLLMVRRAIPPHVGRLALPGGYIDHDESWQEAGARELREEAGIDIDPASLGDFMVRSAADATILIFGLAAPVEESSLPPFAPSHEASERVIVRAPEELAFPLHTEAAGAWFKRRGSAPTRG